MYIKDIVIFGSIDWNTNWQTQHRLVNSYLNEGHRVLFIENTGVRAPRISDFSRLIDRINLGKIALEDLVSIKRVNYLSPIYFLCHSLKYVFLNTSYIDYLNNGSNK